MEKLCQRLKRAQGVAAKNRTVGGAVKKRRKILGKFGAVALDRKTKKMVQ